MLRKLLNILLVVFLIITIISIVTYTFLDIVYSFNIVEVNVNLDIRIELLKIGYTSALIFLSILLIRTKIN